MRLAAWSLCCSPLLLIVVDAFLPKTGNANYRFLLKSSNHFHSAFKVESPTPAVVREFQLHSFNPYNPVDPNNFNNDDDDDYNGEEEEPNKGEGILFNDFDFVIGGDEAAGADIIGNDYDTRPQPVDTALQQRIREQQQQELKRETQLLQNWKRGDWSVRGFSLDPADALNEGISENQSFDQSYGGNNNNNILPIQSTTTPIHVSKVVADANSEGTRVWVGRSNGSLVWVQLGNEYTTHFRSKITGTLMGGDGDPTNNNNQGEKDSASMASSAQFRSELVRDPNSFPFGGGGGGGDGQGSSFLNEPTTSFSEEVPFQVLAQFSPTNANEESPISTILSIPDEDCIFTASDGSGQINQWHISEDDLIDSTKPALQTPLSLSEGIHNDAIIALKTVVYQESPLLLSVSADGVMALWDIPKADLIFHCKISIEDIMESGAGDEENYAASNPPSRVLHCADADDNHIFLGTTVGCVLGYDVSDLLLSASSGGTCPLPLGKFKAHEGGVTAVACGGPGSLGRLAGGGPPGGTATTTIDDQTSSTVLITGGMNGQVKQWEVLSSPSMQKMENWPKISTQRLPKKAHLFEGHNGPITVIEAMGGRRPQFLSASEDGTIRAWDVTKGKENYRMDGFTKELSSLCLLGMSDTDDDFLVTNGMNQYVCLHDFSQGLSGESIDDFLEPWDE